MQKFPLPKVYGAVTVGERGQVVIPAKIRKLYRVKPGDRLIVFAKENGPIAFIPAEQFSEFLDQATQMLARIKKGVVQPQ
jgi:AbrB family looped-hinge helix DNA binding protein